MAEGCAPRSLLYQVEMREVRPTPNRPPADLQAKRALLLMDVGCADTGQVVEGTITIE